LGAVTARPSLDPITVLPSATPVAVRKKSRRLHASMRLSSAGVDADSADSPLLIRSEKLDFITHPTSRPKVRPDNTEFKNYCLAPDASFDE
jgi:hypothetical protein